MEALCSCACGACVVEVSGEPLARYICHCLICQSLFKDGYCDSTAWPAAAVRLLRGDQLNFSRHRKMPPAINRGICRKCDTPVVGMMRAAPFVSLAFVPAANFPSQTTLPRPFGHIFYHRRQQDVDDTLPKISGYWHSEITVTRWIAAGTARRILNAASGR